jgi:hypothetical protein
VERQAGSCKGTKVLGLNGRRRRANDHLAREVAGRNYRQGLCRPYYSSPLLLKKVNFTSNQQPVSEFIVICSPADYEFFKIAAKENTNFFVYANKAGKKQ